MLCGVSATSKVASGDSGTWTFWAVAFFRSRRQMVLHKWFVFSCTLS
jgi:hypothetical protein